MKAWLVGHTVINAVINAPDKNSKSMPDFHSDVSCRTWVYAVPRHGQSYAALQKTSATIHHQHSDAFDALHKDNN